MKVCLFADAGSVHIQQLAPGLAARGHDVHIVTHKPTEVPGATVERFCVPGPSLTNPRRWEGRWVNYLRGFMRRFDVVNIHFLHDWGFHFRASNRTPSVSAGSMSEPQARARGLGRSLALPVRLETLRPPMIENACLIASPWGSDIVDPPGETPATPELTRTRVTLLRGADAVTTCGPTFATLVADYAGIDPGNIDVLPFGVDLSTFKTIRAATVRERAEPYRVGFFKGFREVYGPTYLIQAIPLVLAQIPDTRFELVGDGAQLSLCQHMASDLGVNSSIDWIPRQPHRELPKLMGRWDVTVIPSVQEAFGVAALESSAMEVPVVASDVGGLRDTVRDGQTGLLVPPRSPEAIADALIMILQDADLRRRMGRAGRERVQSEYDWRDLHNRWIKFYEQVRDRICVMV